jgi:hypothetical protein
MKPCIKVVCIIVDNNYGSEEQQTIELMTVTEKYQQLCDTSILNYSKWNVSEKHAAQLPILIINVKQAHPQAFDVSFYDSAFSATYVSYAMTTSFTDHIHKLSSVLISLV